MLLLAAAAQSTQPDYIALAMVLVLALIVVVMVIRKHNSKKHAAQSAPEAPVAPVAEEVQKPTAPGSAGQLKLHDVEPKTAAMLMAIVADKMGKPLNELRFISVKEVK